MVDSMDHAQDVERLFSWIKAPTVHYREFAPQIEVADAVATWPAVHKAAVQTGVADADQPAPHGDSAIKERMARERATLPAAVAESPLAATTAAPTAAPAPGGDPTPAGRRPQPARSESSAGPQAVPPPQPSVSAPPPASGATRPATPVAEAPAQAGERGALFSGEYRGREREAAPRHTPRHPGADRQDRSLDAVFTRLSGGRDRLPDPRERARTTPGLGAIFGRLR
jgi:hypothetical protein